MYKAKTIVIDGITIVENGMIILPEELDWDCLTSEEVSSILREQHSTLTEEEALSLIKQEIYRLPRKQDVIDWVARQSMTFLTKQQDKAIIERTKQRRKNFVKIFEEKYDEETLFERILQYKEEQENGAPELGFQRIMNQTIVKVAFMMLCTVHEMTEYDLGDCYWKIVDEQRQEEVNG